LYQFPFVCSFEVDFANFFGSIVPRKLVEGVITPHADTIFKNLKGPLKRRDNFSRIFCEHNIYWISGRFKRANWCQVRFMYIGSTNVFRVQNSEHDYNYIVQTISLTKAGMVTAKERTLAGREKTRRQTLSPRMNVRGTRKNLKNLRFCLQERDWNVLDRVWKKM
jgi:hypothetical protein